MEKPDDSTQGLSRLLTVLAFDGDDDDTTERGLPKSKDNANDKYEDEYVANRLGSNTSDDSLKASDSSKGGLFARQKEKMKAYVAPLSAVSASIYDGFADSIENLLPKRSKAGEKIATGVGRTYDPQIHPEVNRTAFIRTKSALSDISAEEKQFVRNRLLNMRESFANFIGEKPEDVDPLDIPVISVTGSGGGFKAMIGAAGYLKAMEETGFYTNVTYLSGVSGSCWMLANLYIAAKGSPSVLVEHLKKILVHHPADISRFASIISSGDDAKKHSSLLFDAMTDKRSVGLPRGLVDLYGVMLFAHFLSNEDLSRTWDPDLFKLSKHINIGGSKLPLPIYTAVRHEKPWSKKFEVDPAAETTTEGASQQPAVDQARKQEEFKRQQTRYELRTEAASGNGSADDEDDEDDPNAERAWWQWFEFTPFEFGCDELFWCPTWGFGRKYQRGESIINVPEQSFALVLGLTASAMCAPFTGMFETMERADGDGFMKKFATKVLQWSAQPLVHQLLSKHPDPATAPPGLNHAQRIQLIDAGADNNQALYPMTRPGRSVDVVIVLDASTDVERNFITPDIATFAIRKGLNLTVRPNPAAPRSDSPSAPRSRSSSSDNLQADLPPPLPPRSIPAQLQPPSPYPPRTTSAVPPPLPPRLSVPQLLVPEAGLTAPASPISATKKFPPHRYCQVYTASPAAGTAHGAPPVIGPHGEQLPQNDMKIVYLPLIANPEMPDFSPSKFTFAKMQYEKDEVEDLARCAYLNWMNTSAQDQVREIVRELWMQKRDARVEQARNSNAYIDS
ncbi:acyl transferase/acyl hydrolase/lysophospholipase [Cladochytrium replicatum]|nr:acyl transferase/acyl hydrolase/lysophospholipase [Cladochytrium replicatum]